MFVINHRKFFYGLSILLVIASVAAVGVWGLNLGIDFKGGSIIEVEYATQRPDQEILKTSLANLDLRESIRPTGDKGYLIRMRSIDPTEKTSLVAALGSFGTSTEKRFDSIGPVLGTEAARKSVASIAFVLIAIVLFITYAFRQVSKPVSSWKYGIVAIVALLHDVVIPVGAFAFLGHFYGFEVDTLFVTAILVILGFSVHDTIVVFDRVRENLRHAPAKKPFNEIVGESVSQTVARSINTSLTTLLALLALYFVGGTPTQHFTLALIIGIAAGTYSSVFIGSPLLVTLQMWQDKKAGK